MSFKLTQMSKSSTKNYKSRIYAATSSPPSSRTPSPTSSSGSGTSFVQIHTPPESDVDIDKRTELEKSLFQLVENGNTEAVQQFIKDNKAIDINQRDTDGSSVLHKAVINEDNDMVDALLAADSDVNIDDSLLHAIKNNSMQMVLKLLKHQDTNSRRKNVLSQLFTKTIKKFDLDLDSSVHGEDITPMLMAAMSGHYEIIELLYNRSPENRLKTLHFPSCICEECGSSTRDLKKSNNRIHLLRGLANPTYISFMAGVDKGFDPIQKVFELVADIKTCMREEPEFRDEYEEIMQGIVSFPVDMLSMCRNSNEAKIFFRKKDGYTGLSPLPYPRLLLAMDLNQKEFVAHPHAQDILYQDWLGESWVTTNFSENLLRNIFMAILLVCTPIFSILILLTMCCCHKFQCFKFITSPINRFKSSCISYLFFLLVIFYINRTEKLPADLDPPTFYLPWVVGTFVLSNIISYLSHFLINPKYFMDGWNMFDLINHLFFKATISLWVMVYYRKKAAHMEMRHELEPFDSVLLAEIALGLATTMAALKPLRAFMLHPNLGPLQVALGKMSKDLVSFAVFFAVIIFSFALGAQHLYRPYSSFTKPDGELIGEHKKLASFTTALEAFYWAMFTMTGADSPTVDEIPLAGNVTNHHFVTESVGKIIFVAYHILAVTFLMNMLTGVMSNTYGRIVDNVNAEWKHARSRIWVYYIQNTIVTAPFDIIPNGLFLLNINAWMRVIAGNIKQDDACCLASCCNSDNMRTDEEKNELKHEYAILIRRLLQRYFRSKNSTASEDSPAKDDVISVHNHVFELKGMTKLTLEKDLSPQTSIRSQGLASDTEGNSNEVTGTIKGSSKNPSTVASSAWKSGVVTLPNKEVPSNNHPLSVNSLYRSSPKQNPTQTALDPNQSSNLGRSVNFSTPESGTGSTAEIV